MDTGLDCCSILQGGAFLAAASCFVVTNNKTIQALNAKQYVITFFILSLFLQHQFLHVSIILIT